VLEGQEKTIQAQGEALKRQEQMIAAQQGEIEELRRISQDQVTFRGAADSMLGTETSSDSRSQTFGASQVVESQAVRETALVQPQLSNRTLESRYFGKTGSVQPQISDNAGGEPMRGAYDWQNGQQRKGAVDLNQQSTAVSAGTKLSLTAECAEAETEVKNAVGSEALADKLFHYRRALRLCPDNPAYHNGMGEVYLSLQRVGDAEYEFKEALRLDPGYSPARQNLDSLRSLPSRP